MSLSEFEAAVGGESAARHAYLDALQAALPACEDGKTRAIDESDFDEAAIFSAIAKSIRAILSGIEKPVSKADIRASLDGGVFEAPHRQRQRKKSGIERDIGQAPIAPRYNSAPSSDDVRFNNRSILQARLSDINLREPKQEQAAGTASNCNRQLHAANPWWQGLKSLSALLNSRGPSLLHR
jgi:hypothetical protein